MALPAILAGLGGAVGTGLGYAGAAASHPLGQAAIATALPDLYQKGKNWWNGPQAPNQDVNAQQNFLQGIQRPINIDWQALQQEARNRFNTQTIPEMQNQWAGLGAGGHQSNLFGQQQMTAGNELETMLAALQARSQLAEQEAQTGRLGQLGNYLGGQQQLGLNAQEINQRGAIANREAALRGLGLFQNYDIGRQGEQTRKDDVISRLLGGLGNQSLNKRFDTKHFAAQAPGYYNLATGAAKAGTQALFGLPT